jgi:hypothetical protein
VGKLAIELAENRDAIHKPQFRLGTSQGGIAQVRLVPSSAPNFPTQGSIGDLFVHQVPPAAGS